MAITQGDPLGSRTIHNTLRRKLTMRTLVLCLVVMLAAFVSLANAEVTINEKIPINQTVFVPCANNGTGESLVLGGTLHILSVVNIGPDPGDLKIKQHFQPQGAGGQGTMTGDRYNATGVTPSTMPMTGVGFPYQYTYVHNFRMIGRGNAVNFTVHQTVHVTVNPNGVGTSQVDNFKTECK